jgi:hypothetical protein
MSKAVGIRLPDDIYSNLEIVGMRYFPKTDREGRDSFDLTQTIIDLLLIGFTHYQQNEDINFSVETARELSPK